MSDYSIQVTIVTYNSAESIRACIQSVINADVQPEDIYILDNYSADQTCQTISTEYPAVKLICNESNVGFGAGHNILFDQSQSDYVLLLNPDATIQPDLVNNLVSELEDKQELAIVAPRVNYPDGYPQVSFGSFPPGAIDPEHRTMVKSAQKRDEQLSNQLKEILSDMFYPDWVSGSCLMIRRKAIQMVDGFDEGFFLYVEDVDLCKRLRARGWDIAVQPSVVCSHIEGASSQGAGASSIHFRNSKLRYLNKHCGFGSYLLYALLKKPAAMFQYDSSLNSK